MADKKPIIVQTSGQLAQIPDADVLIVNGGIDTSGATPLLIGATNASAIDIGQPGVTTTIKGDLGVDGDEIVVGTTTFEGDTQIGDATTDKLAIVAGLEGGPLLGPNAPILPVDDSGGAREVVIGSGAKRLRNIHSEEYRADDTGGTDFASLVHDGLTFSLAAGGSQVGLFVDPPTTVNANGNALVLPGGNSDGSGTGGNAVLIGGQGGTTGAGGEVHVYGGSGGTAGGAGGAVQVFGGDAAAGNNNGGDVVVRGGAKTGTGVNGSVYLGTANTVWVICGTHLIPSADYTYDLGENSTPRRWRNVYAQNFVGGFSPSSSIIPSLDNSYDLGSLGYRWRTLYLGPLSLNVYQDPAAGGAPGPASESYKTTLRYPGSGSDAELLFVSVAGAQKLSVKAGDTTTGGNNGNALEVLVGSAGPGTGVLPGGTGGNLTLTSGAGGSDGGAGGGNAGSVAVSGGVGGGGGSGGTGTGGNITLDGGVGGATGGGGSPSSAGGAITATGGTGGAGGANVGETAGAGGDAGLIGGNAGADGGGGGAVGGAAKVWGGGGSGAFAGGNAYVEGGTGGASGVGGHVILRGGAAGAGSDGEIRLGDTNTSQVVSYVYILPNNDDSLEIGSTSARWADIHSTQFTAHFDNTNAQRVLYTSYGIGCALATAPFTYSILGNTVTTPAQNGGQINVTGGTGNTTGAGGPIIVSGGNGGASGAGGSVTVQGGTGNGAAVGGNLTLRGGTGAGGDGVVYIGVTQSSQIQMGKLGADVVPSADNVVNHGSASLRWASSHAYAFVTEAAATRATLGGGGTGLIYEVFAGGGSFTIDSLAPTTLNANGNDLNLRGGPGNGTGLGGNVYIDAGAGSTNGIVYLGNSNTSEVDCGTDFLPTVDNTYDIGSTTRRWAEGRFGPGSVYVHNDNTNTDYVKYAFSGISLTKPAGGGVFLISAVAPTTVGAAGAAFVMSAQAGNGAGTGGKGTLSGGNGGATGPGGGGQVTGGVGFGGANGGDAQIKGGAAFGGGTAGRVYVGDSDTSIVEIGAAAIPTSVNGNLLVDGNTTLGNASGDKIYFTAQAASHLIPDTDYTYDLGENVTPLRWRNIYAQNIYGSVSPSGNLLPAADNTYDLGSLALRWKTLYLGPASLNVYQDPNTTGSASESYKLTVGYPGGGSDSQIQFVSVAGGRKLSINHATLTAGTSATGNATEVFGGKGSNASGAGAAGGSGGSVTIRAGAGGDGSGADNPGNGGNLVLQGGTTGSPPGNANGGLVQITGGTGVGTGTSGSVVINAGSGGTTAGGVAIGNSMAGAIQFGSAFGGASVVTLYPNIEPGIVNVPSVGTAAKRLLAVHATTIYARNATNAARLTENALATDDPVSFQILPDPQTTVDGCDLFLTGGTTSGAANNGGDVQIDAGAGGAAGLGGNVIINANSGGTSNGYISLGTSLTLLIQVGCTLQPNVDNTIKLGTTSNRWSEVHGTILRADGAGGTNNVRIDNGQILHTLPAGAGKFDILSAQTTTASATGNQIAITGGQGGDASVAGGGTGGRVDLTAGRGGASSATKAAGAGGNAYLTGGLGGPDTGGGGGNIGGNAYVTGGAATQGNGGSITITGGAAAVSGQGGTVTINGGAGAGAGTAGGVVIGNSSATVQIGGGSNPTITFSGSGKVTGSAAQWDLSAATELDIPDTSTATIKIGGVAQGVNWTGANMAVLFAGPASDASSLHTHTGLSSSSVDVSGTAKEALVVGQPVLFYNDAGTAKVRLSDANAAGRKDCVGLCSLAAAGDGNATKIRTSGEISTTIGAGTYWDTDPAVGDVGKRVYISLTQGKLTYDVSGFTTTGDMILRVGWISRVDVPNGKAYVVLGIGEGVEY